jgi:lactoylglutathione lyase
MGGAGVSVTGIHHVALWVADLERARAFYADLLGGRAGALYHNERTGFRSYFVSFGAGARLELMSRPDVVAAGRASEAEGFAHVALSVGGRDEVDACVDALERAGVAVASRPRRTGDGYYEAVVLDPEGNRVEITE